MLRRLERGDDLFRAYQLGEILHLPLSAIQDMALEEFEGWFVYLQLTGRLKAVESQGAP